jgi:hypothetical protein
MAALTGFLFSPGFDHLSPVVQKSMALPVVTFWFQWTVRSVAQTADRLIDYVIARAENVRSNKLYVCLAWILWDSLRRALRGR